MAGSNQLVPRPPNNSPIVEDKTHGFGPARVDLANVWFTWFDTVHRKISPSRSKQAITAATAVNLDSTWVTLDSTGGGYAITLDAPTAPGVWLGIEMTVNTGSVTLALTNCIGGTAATTCTWNNTNQVLLLVSISGSKWLIYKQQGVTLT